MPPDMGMFDYIRCKMPLPTASELPAIEWFQTKDVPTEQLYLEKWSIEQDGRLIKLGVRYEDRSDKAAEPGSFDSIAGCMTPVAVPEEDMEIPFHGHIRFYHYDEKTRVSWEYIAKFTDGRCVLISDTGKDGG